MLWWTLQNLLIAAVLAGGVWLICRWSNVSPATRHALWLIVLLKLLTPPLIVWPWPISMPVTRSQELQPVAAETGTSVPAMIAADRAVVPLPVEEALPEILITSPETPTLERVDEPQPQTFFPTPQRSYIAIESLLAMAWCSWFVGGLIFASLQGWRIVRMARMVHRAAPANEVLKGHISELARKLAMPAVAARQASGITAPLIWTVARPVLLWPTELNALPLLSQQSLLLHELAHVKRRDHWVGWLELIAGCLWWWNPLFWYVRHQLRENAELACDAWVVATIPKSRRAYADALLFVCERMSCPRAMFAVGVSAGGRHWLERRLTMILRQQVSLRLSRTGLCGLKELTSYKYVVYGSGHVRE